MKIMAGNWKLNFTGTEATEFLTQYKKLVKDSPNKVVICAPFTTLSTLARYKKETGIITGAQNLHPALKGTFTGEVNAKMLVDSKVEVVIVGHSERRAIFGETDEFVNQKVKAAQESGLIAILCVGETSAEREAGETFSILQTQLEGSLKGVTNAKNLWVAYEPIWAISTGDPNKPSPIPTDVEIMEAHSFIRKFLDKQFGKNGIPILYGGSANPNNMNTIFKLKNVDGALIGGASLVAEKFAAMANWHE